MPAFFFFGFSSFTQHLGCLRATRALPWSTLRMMSLWALRPLAFAVGLALALMACVPGVTPLAALAAGILAWAGALMVTPMCLLLGFAGFTLSSGLVTGAMAIPLREMAHAGTSPPLIILAMAALFVGALGQVALYRLLERSSRVYQGMRMFGLLGGDAMW